MNNNNIPHNHNTNRLLPYISQNVRLVNDLSDNEGYDAIIPFRPGDIIKRQDNVLGRMSINVYQPQHDKMLQPEEEEKEDEEDVEDVEDEELWVRQPGETTPLATKQTAENT